MADEKAVAVSGVSEGALDGTGGHKPSKCSVCGEVLAFVQYRTKVGKDGRLAKWPEYARCSKIKHVSRQPVVPDPVWTTVVDVPVRILDGTSKWGSKGVLYQIPVISPVEICKVVESFIGKYGKWPVAIRLNPVERSLLVGVDEVNGVEVKDDPNLSPNYHYIFLEAGTE